MPYADVPDPAAGGAGAAAAAGRRRAAPAVRLRAGHRARPRRRPAPQPGQVRHGRVAGTVIGVGIDVVDIERFGDSLTGPSLRHAAHAPEATRPLASLAARFAAKEAIAKALGAPGDLHWHDAEVVSEAPAAPARARGTVLARADDLGVTPCTSRSPTTPASPPPSWSARATTRRRVVSSTAMRRRRPRPAASCRWHRVPARRRGRPGRSGHRPGRTLGSLSHDRRDRSRLRRPGEPSASGAGSGRERRRSRLAWRHAARAHRRAGPGGRGGADGAAARGRADAAGRGTGWRTPWSTSSGRRTGGGCCCWSGSGDNGGDALYAGAMLARRGAARRGLAALATARTSRGWPRCERAGGRVVTEPGRRPEVVVDGIVGIGGRAGLKPEAAAALELLHGVPVVAVDTPSGVGVDTGEVDGDHVARRAHRHLRHPQGLPPRRPGRARPCGAVHLVDLGLDLPEARARGAPARGRRGAAAAPGAGQPEVRPRRGRRPRRQRAVPRRRPAQRGRRGRAGWPGWCATSATRRSPTPCASSTPRWSAPAGSRPGWSAPAAASSAGDELRAALADDVPLVVDADALQHVDDPARPRCSPRTPASSPRCSARSARTSRRSPLQFARAAAERYDAVVLLKGRRTVVARPRRPGPGQHHRHRLAGHRRRRRRPRRRGRRAARRRAHAVRRRERRRLAARRGRDAGLRRRSAGGQRGWRRGAARPCVARIARMTAARRARGRPGRDPAQRAAAQASSPAPR